MNSTRRIALFLVFVALLLAGLAGSGFAGGGYVCPPCGQSCDTTHFAGPGTCPQCGMALVEASAAAAAAAKAPPQKKVAILVFNGVEILDYTGPYEMFGAAGCDVYTVAASREPVTTAMGMSVVPKFTFAEAPQPDVLVIPGGGVKAASGDAATLRYIEGASAGTSATMSVCNGAFILANTGLLDGLSATTTNGNIPRLAHDYPKITVVRDKRYVDNGRFVTAAGLSAGIDGALHVIERMFGTGYAQQVALGEEYDWRPAAGFARAALADHEIPQVDMDSMGDWKLARTEGDRRHWDIEMNGRCDMTTGELTDRIEQALTAGKWTRAKSVSSGTSTRVSDWRFTGSDGKPWKGTLKVERIGNAGAGGHAFKAALVIDRAG